MAGNKTALLRLQKEFKALNRDPVPHVTAHPLPNDLLTWHFVLEGTGEFEGGVYHGKLVFPPTYPMKPPSISILTPNGRFAVNTKLCLSFTDFHPEAWNPMWSVGTILTGLLSFMYDSAPTTGSISTSKAEKARLAGESLGFNCRNATFRKLFPAWVEEHTKRQAAAAAAAQATPQQQQQQQLGPAPAGGQPQQVAPQDALGTARGGQAAQQRGPVAAGAAGQPAPGHSMFTAAVAVICVLAIAVVPLLSLAEAGGGVAGLGWLRPRDSV